VPGPRVIRATLTRRELRPFLLALIVGLCARWLYVYATVNFRLLHDNLGYVLRGQYLAAHHTLMPIVDAHHRTYPDAYWPPFFPIVLAALSKLRSWAVALWFGGHFRPVVWLRLAMSTINALSLGGLALIAFRLWGRRVALVTAWLGALYLPWIDVGASLYSESLLTVLVIAMCVAVIEYRRTGRRLLLVCAGLLAGLAAMTHGNGIVLVPIACVGVWGRGRRGTPPRDVRRLRPVLAVVAAAAAVVVPWTVRNAIEVHAFVPIATSLGNTLAGTYSSRSAHNSPPARWLSPSRSAEYRAIYRRLPIASPAQDAALERRARQYIEAHPRYLLTVGVWNTANLLGFTYLDYTLADARRQRLPAWSVYAQRWAFWILGILAIAGALTRRAREAPRWLWTVPILLFLTVVWVGAGSPLYREPVDPFLILLAACGCEATARHLRASIRRPGLKRSHQPGRSGTGGSPSSVDPEPAHTGWGRRTSEVVRRSRRCALVVSERMPARARYSETARLGSARRSRPRRNASKTRRTIPIAMIPGTDARS
jgi:4-amino-4-deoxy-L-arabinose transferase-like glycosyltransferase